jgi:hypothetical protein
MRTIFLVLAAFLLTWIPMLVLALLEMIRYLGGLGSWTPPHWLYVFAMWSMCAGSVTYPILYGIYNRAIRKELRICLSCSGGLNTKKWRNVNHFYQHGGSGHGGGQRRGSKWSNYSGPRFNLIKIKKKVLGSFLLCLYDAIKETFSFVF